jgi:hypothetical protein
VYRTFARAADHCAKAGCSAAAGAAGPDMELRCPPPGAATAAGLQGLLLLRLEPMALECVGDGGRRLQLLPWLVGTEAPAPAYGRASSAPRLGAGGVAGLVVALLVLVVAAAALLYTLAYKRWYQERRALAFGRMEDGTGSGAGAQPAPAGPAGHKGDGPA